MMPSRCMATNGIVVPFYVCDVAQPILSATRLAEQGFEITLSETANNQTHEWIRINIEATTWPILLVSEDNRNTNQHTIGCIRNRARHQSNNLTRHIDSNRSQMGDTQQRRLDVQQPRFSRKTTQETTTSNIHT